MSKRKLMIVEKERPDKDIGTIDIDITGDFIDEMEDIKALIKSNPKDAEIRAQSIIDAMDRYLRGE